MADLSLIPEASWSEARRRAEVIRPLAERDHRPRYMVQAAAAIFAALAEFERELIIERTHAGLASARARGRSGGRPFKMTSAKLRLAQAAMGQPDTKVAELCTELGVSRQTLYRHVDPKGVLRPDGERLLGDGMGRIRRQAIMPSRLSAQP